MVRVRRRSAPPLIHYVPSRKVALQVINNHLEPLQEKLKSIEEMNKCLSPSKLLDMDGRELLPSWPGVVDQINVLEKLKSKSTESHPLSAIAEQLRDLLPKQASISQIEEEYLCQGESLNGSQRRALLSKSEVVHQFDVLEKIFKEICLEQLPSEGAERDRGAVGNQSHPLLSKSTSSEVRGYAEVLEEEFYLGCMASRYVEFRPSMNENETRDIIKQDESEPLDKHRYLCLTNGWETLYLDLKQSKDLSFNNAADVPLLPKIAALNLQEEGLPLAVGLFKWRSDAYMIGGQKLPAALLLKPNCRTFSDTHKVRGSSCVTYGLCLDGSKTTLSYSESTTIGRLKKPKLWPIVEEINGQIHVIDSLPRWVSPLGLDWTFSHEVFNCVTGSWIEEIPTIMQLEDDVIYNYVRSHSVVGHRIYAVTGVGFLAFDSINKKWEAHPRLVLKDILRNVWHILERGPARCVRRFTYGDPCNPLYVLIGLHHDLKNDTYGTHAVAYLITSDGQIVCIQPLPHFLKGPVWPCHMFLGTIMQVDEEGNTMCSIVTGSTSDNSDTFNYIFINTFTVEILGDAVRKVARVLRKGSKAWPVEEEFVRVDIKDNYIYKTDSKLEGGVDIRNWAGVQACIL